MSCLCLQYEAAELSQSQVKAGTVLSPFLGHFTGSKQEGPVAKSQRQDESGQAPLGAGRQTCMAAILYRLGKDSCCLATDLGRDAGDQMCISVAMNITSAVCHFERP